MEGSGSRTTEEQMINLIKYFLFLGTTGFGGPLSLIQQMRQHFVEDTKTIEASLFDQAFTLIKAMPGPIAYQMALFCGQQLKGRMAGFVSGVALIFPAFLMMIALGLGYNFLNSNPILLKVLNGFQFAVAAIILMSLKTFVIQNKNKVIFWCLLVLAAVLYLYNLLPEPVIIIGFGLCAIAYTKTLAKKLSWVSTLFFVPNYDQLVPLFKTCAYAGALVFGTGLALIPILQSSFVAQYHWLDLQTFNDGVTFGQMTPGPVTITATFLGFKIAGLVGAVVATMGIFLFPTFHILTWFPKVLGWMSKQSWIQPFLLGATAAVVGVLLITIYRMNAQFISIINFWIIFLSSFIYLIFKPKTQVLWVVVYGGVANLIIFFATMNSI